MKKKFAGDREEYGSPGLLGAALSVPRPPGSSPECPKASWEHSPGCPFHTLARWELMDALLFIFLIVLFQVNFFQIRPHYVAQADLAPTCAYLPSPRITGFGHLI